MYDISIGSRPTGSDKHAKGTNTPEYIIMAFKGTNQEFGNYLKGRRGLDGFKNI